jgi:acyl-coenzyme A thioesterase PaaI-like protein
MFQKLFQLPKLAKYAAPSKKWMDLFEFDVRNIDISKEKLSCTISFPEKLTGNDGIIHGGITCFVIDSIAGIFASISHDESLKIALTKNISVSFLQPIQPFVVYTISARRKNDTEFSVVITDNQNNEMSTGLVDVAFK